jgi:hypothetical protein
MQKQIKIKSPEDNGSLVKLIFADSFCMTEFYPTSSEWLTVDTSAESSMRFLFIRRWLSPLPRTCENNVRIVLRSPIDSKTLINY